MGVKEGSRRVKAGWNPEKIVLHLWFTVLNDFLLSKPKR